MFGNSVTLFEFLGFRVRANVSWLFLALLITWSLAGAFFPQTYPGLTAAIYWTMGVVGMIGLFFSLLFHEFAHSLVARVRGLKIRGITLFLFGGVAEMEMEPDSPKTEFWMAIAGPAASVLLAGVFYALALGLDGVGIVDYVAGVPLYLAYINLLLAIFNMMPGFPLDGGRVFRAALWHFQGDLRRATRWATRAGQAFGLLLAALGFLNWLSGNFIGGMWWILIGLFLFAAAGASYQRMRAQQALKGQTIGEIMTRDPVTVSPDITIRQFIDDYLYQYSHDVFPVVSDGRLVGCVGTRDIREVPREEWGVATLSKVLRPCSANNTIAPDVEASRALEVMRSAENGRLLVAENSHLVGVIVLKDLLHRLALRSEIEAVD